jgi:hypothetical protein
MHNKNQKKFVTALKILSILVLIVVVGFGVVRVSAYIFRGVQLQNEAPFMNPPSMIS